MRTEQELLQLARQLDQEALAEIYDRFSPELYRYAVRLLSDAEGAEECVAETFSRFLHSLHRGGGPRQHLRAYLFRIAHNWITDSYRRQPPPMLPLDGELLRASERSNPQSALEAKIEREEMLQALRLLTPDQRQVIILKFIEGWRNKEVAEALGKPVGAVKALQSRGLAALQRILLPRNEVAV